VFKKPIIARLSISAVVFVITSVVAFLVWSQYNEKDAYDLVIMDLHMPVMDGMEASQIILKKRPDMPIIMLSANVTKEAVTKAKEVGIEYYITKPVSKEKLLQTINKALKTKHGSK
jgi:CheY-like chemotaxis protein